MELTFEITNQSLKRIDTNKPADYSNEYLKCQFDFQSEDWEPMGKFAIFKTGELNYRVAINDGECIVPFDALQVNQFALTVYGVDGDTRITTNLVYIKLGKSGFVTEYDESSYFNPDMTEQLCEALTKKADKTYVDNGLDEKAGLVHSHIEADISDLKDYALVSDVPTKTSDLVNDVPFLTQHQDISGKADKSYVDTELDKKADIVDVPTKTSDLVNDVPFLTEHQDISSKADKSYVDTALESKVEVSDFEEFDENIGMVLEDKADTVYVDTELAGKQDNLTGYADVPNLEAVEITVTYTDGTTETFELLRNVGE